MSLPKIHSVDSAMLPFVWRIPSRYSKRGLALSTLRPGDYLDFRGQYTYLVLQNSATLQKLEVCSIDWKFHTPKRGKLVTYAEAQFLQPTYAGRSFWNRFAWR
jgi:hypothetical protein